MNDTVRAAIRSFIESVISLIVILHFVDLSQGAVGAIMLAVTNALTLTQYIWKTGQSS